jgi:hypothetical protein
VPFVGHLDPDESLGEILAGLIMVLTFTLAAGVATRGAQDSVRTLLLAAVGCNLAWGIIDAVFYVMTNAFVRRRRARLFRAVSAAASEDAALATIRHELDPELEAITRPEDRERLYRDIHVLLANGKPLRTGVTRDDLIGALIIFCLVFATTLPAVLPFLFVAIRGLRCASRTCFCSVASSSSVSTGRDTSTPTHGWQALHSPVSAWCWSPSRWPWGADTGTNALLRGCSGNRCYSQQSVLSAGWALVNGLAAMRIASAPRPARTSCWRIWCFSISPQRNACPSTLPGHRICPCWIAWAA